MAQIPLSRGMFATVDDADVPLVSALRWCALPSKRTWYAQSSIKRKTVYMHRLLLGNPRLSVDHINGDGLDNRRCNLREATASQQARNSRPKGGRSRFKGVSIHNPSGLWMATIELPQRKRKVRYAHSELEAAMAYNELASTYFGEFARLNEVGVEGGA